VSITVLLLLLSYSGGSGLRFTLCLSSRGAGRCRNYSLGQEYPFARYRRDLDTKHGVCLDQLLGICLAVWRSRSRGFRLGVPVTSTDHHAHCAKSTRGIVAATALFDHGD
jgi:hypothetical protein